MIVTQLLSLVGFHWLRDSRTIPLKEVGDVFSNAEIQNSTNNPHKVKHSKLQVD